MNSCLYECHILHHRFSPKAHRFLYRIFLFALDLDELDSLHRHLRLFSLNQRNLYSFRESDYLPTSEVTHNPSGPGPAPTSGAQSLKARVITHLATQGST